MNVAQQKAELQPPFRGQEQLSVSKATPQMADLSQLVQPGHRTTEVLLPSSKYQQALAVPSLCIF